MILPSEQPPAALQSWNAAKLAFFGDPLVRLIGALYPILVVLALERQKLRHPVDAICPATIEWPRGEARADVKRTLRHGTWSGGGASLGVGAAQGALRNSGDLEAVCLRLAGSCAGHPKPDVLLEVPLRCVFGGAS